MLRKTCSTQYYALACITFLSMRVFYVYRSEQVLVDLRSRLFERTVSFPTKRSCPSRNYFSTGSLLADFVLSFEERNALGIVRFCLRCSYWLFATIQAYKKLPLYVWIVCTSFVLFMLVPYADGQSTDGMCSVLV